MLLSIVWLFCCSVVLVSSYLRSHSFPASALFCSRGPRGHTLLLPTVSTRLAMYALQPDLRHIKDIFNYVLTVMFYIDFYLRSRSFTWDWILLNSI